MANAKQVQQAYMVQKLKDYYVLAKVRLSLLVVFSSVMSYLIVVPGAVDYVVLLLLGVGGFFLTAAATAINQVLERDYDRMMQRTADRPLAAGRMSVSEAVFSAGIFALVGITLLSAISPAAGLIGSVSFILYAFVYTPIKRVSPVAVHIGAVPGALPLMIGCVAAQGELTTVAWVLFGIQFFWQFPHFWAIAWLAHEDYAKAGFKLLPSRSGERDAEVGIHATITALCLVPLGWLMYTLGYSGIIAAIILTILSLAYTAYSVQLSREQDRGSALRLMFASFFYVPLAMFSLLWF